MSLGCVGMGEERLVKLQLCKYYVKVDRDICKGNPPVPMKLPIFERKINFRRAIYERVALIRSTGTAAHHLSTHSAISIHTLHEEMTNDFH